MGADEFFVGEFVEFGREAFGQAARIRENNGGVVSANKFEKSRVHMGPDAGACLRRRFLAILHRCRVHVCHVINRNDDLDI